MIYLDNAATTLYKPQEVDAAILDALHTAGNPGRGAHEPTPVSYTHLTLPTIA